MTTDSTKETVDITPLEKKIIRQVEYYFGDVNLQRDKFLNEKVKECDGWVTLECLTTFNRLKQLSTDLEEIRDSLKKSTSGLLEIHTDELKVRRSPERPLPNRDDPMVRKASKDKTLYIKGFPTSYTMDSVQTYLDEKTLNTVFVKLRKDNKSQFKGSIFVELSTVEEAKRLLDDRELKCEDSLLTVLLRDDYFNQKNLSRKENDAMKKEFEASKPKLQMKKGCILHFKGVVEKTRRESIKEVFEKHQQIAWVDFNIGDTEGFIRFENEGTAEKALNAVKTEEKGNVVVINGDECTFRLLEGEEEDNYWKTLEEDMRKKGKGDNRGRGRGRGNRGRGGRDFKRKRPWEHKKTVEGNVGDAKVTTNEHVKFTEEVSPSKKSKTEA